MTLLDPKDPVGAVPHLVSDRGQRDRDVQRQAMEHRLRVLGHRLPASPPPRHGRYAVTALIRAEPQPVEGHRSSEFAWWEHVAASPGPRVVVMHDVDEPRGQGAYWGEVQANIHRALAPRGGDRRHGPDLPRPRPSASSSSRRTCPSPTPTSTWSTSASR